MIKNISENRKARYEYIIEDEKEAGIELYGTEVKSIRQGKINIKESYCKVIEGEIYIIGMHISPYEKGNIYNKDPLRIRKLLMHKIEIRRLEKEVMREGYTLVPIRVYLKGSRVKISVGICKGKKNYDKREAEKNKEAKRAAEKGLKEINRYN